MKTKHIITSVLAVTAISLGNISCTDDLNQFPHTETTSKEVYTNLSNYKAVLAKLYTSMVVNGQGKGGENADLSSNNGQDYMRCWFNLQECGTDEMASTWLSGAKTGAIP